MRRLIKPYLWARPDLIRRSVRAELRGRFGPRTAPITVTHVIGTPITVWPGDYVGRCVRRLGFYDLCVSETLLRLTDPGDMVVDAGANVGAMTAVLSRAAGRTGKVVCYEPQPRIAAVLQHNAARWSSSSAMAPVEVRRTALGACTGTGWLGFPPGTRDPSDARLNVGDSADEGLAEVAVSTLDEDLARADVIKLDIEDGEDAALRGATRLLSTRAIRDVVFEDFVLDTVGRSAVSDQLTAHGYSLFALGARLRGLHSVPLAARAALDTLSEPPNYLATRDPDRAADRLHGPEWKLLSTAAH